MHTCAHGDGWVLFTWELRKKATGRRWFYMQLERTLSSLPPRGWRKLGGSVYLVKAGHSSAFDELLDRFEGPDLKWHKLRVETFLSTAHVCTQVRSRNSHGWAR